MTTLTAPPAVRPDLSAGAPWLAPAAVLAAELAVRRQLPDDTAARVQHALGWVEDFDSTRQSLAANGDLKAVTASPILAEEGRALLHLAIQENVQRTLEIGFAFGMSACHLLLAHEITGGGQHTAIDPFQLREYYGGCGLMNVYGAHLGQRFLWLREMSNRALPRLLEAGEPIDLAFIDGSHLFSDMFVDANYCHYLLRPGGVLVLHDAFLAATRTVANILITNFGYVNESAEDVPNFMILRKTGADHLDWTAFASQFVPFEVERD